ncbi:hypothetical protein [Streptomyces torulosus]|uniref:hypothetical protein n=1 Tax=Streptomyces torulosus TaxID=68276 RepID=UPI0006EBB659|nr:hypothetical protein [Streptomyces torulosus]
MRQAVALPEREDGVLFGDGFRVAAALVQHPGLVGERGRLDERVATGALDLFLACAMQRLVKDNPRK